MFSWLAAAGEGSVVHVCDSDVLEVKLRNELLELERKNEKNVKLQNQVDINLNHFYLDSVVFVSFP